MEELMAKLFALLIGIYLACNEDDRTEQRLGA